MSKINRLNRKLYEKFDGNVSAHIDGECVVLTGSLSDWNSIVSAGQLAAKHRNRLGVINDIEFTGAPIPPMKLPLISDSKLEGNTPDVMVIGAGVVGCAIARELMRYDVSVLLVDKEHDVAMHASSRNDGMIHPGLDLKKGQVKEKYNAKGNAMYDKVCSELGVKFERIGQYLCFKERGMRLIAHIAPAYWVQKGIPCKYIGAERLHATIEGLDKEILFALFFPTAGIVCPYGLTIAYAENAVDNGAQISLDTAAIDMNVKNGEIKSVSTNRGTVYPKVVVNAAGVFSEDVAVLAEDRFFSIHPRKGTNAILDKKVSRHLNEIVSTLSAQKTKSKNTKGGGIVRTIDSNVLIGPDAVETYEKENFETAADSIDDSFRRHVETSPFVRQSEIITYFTGVRAATYEEDFVVTKGKKTRNLVHAAGIQSPGLTSAPAIAVDVASMAAQLVAETRAVGKNNSFDPIRKPIVKTSELSMEERGEIIAENHDYGEIVCRCEEVSRGEIIAALHRSVPCDTVDGVKRRVRPGMGRCQGGFCGPLVAQIISEELDIPLDAVTKNGKNSHIVLCDTKGGTL
ncbi:MAG: NAD(P)/FAD-dependent oxidoreductase [Oscillospiraceae bacterium]